MSTTSPRPSYRDYPQPPPLPDHTQLPDRDDNFVKNFQEHPQAILLTDSIGPLLEALHPDGRYAIGQDCGIYWRLTEPLVKGAICPDWFYVPGVPAKLDGKFRRSYVLWQEWVAPLIALEFASGDGSDERDRTPNEGKFWIYENIVRPPYYGILDVVGGSIEMWHLVDNRYRPSAANEHGRYPVPPLGVELGIWHGFYQNTRFPWLRWWDARGELLPTGHELAEKEAERAEREAGRARQEFDRAERESSRAELESDRAEMESSRAERESSRAEREASRAERLAEQLRALGIEPET